MGIVFKKEDEILGIQEDSEDIDRMETGRRDVKIGSSPTELIGMPSDIEREVGGILGKSVRDFIKEGKPLDIVKRVERWCASNNSETAVNHKNISKIKDKAFFKIIYNVLESKKPKRFTTKDVIEWTGARNLTGGEIQRRVLASMVCLGIISKIRKEITSKDKETKRPAYEFSWNTEHVRCPNCSNDKCTWNWKKESGETEYDFHQD